MLKVNNKTSSFRWLNFWLREDFIHCSGVCIVDFDKVNDKIIIFRGYHMNSSFSACNFIKKETWHRCFPMNFAKFLRTPLLQNISGRLLLNPESFGKLSGKTPQWISSISRSWSMALQFHSEELLFKNPVQCCHCYFKARYFLARYFFEYPNFP